MPLLVFAHPSDLAIWFDPSGETINNDKHVNTGNTYWQHGKWGQFEIILMLLGVKVEHPRMKAINSCCFRSGGTNAFDWRSTVCSSSAFISAWTLPGRRPAARAAHPPRYCSSEIRPSQHRPWHGAWMPWRRHGAWLAPLGVVSCSHII